VAEIQRSRVLAAVVQECSERGVGNVTVAHVVARAGVSRRTFYELYPDREACFLGAFDEGVARASRYVLDAYDPKGKWVGRLRVALTRLLTFLDFERGIGQLLIVGSLGAGATALERRKQILAEMIALVDEGRNDLKSGKELPLLTPEGIVGGVMSVLHSRLLDEDEESLLQLAGPLMSMIVLPYLGPTAARRELARPAPKPADKRPSIPTDPLRDIGVRLTYRTVRVLMSVAAQPGSSNREIGFAADMQDQGQISKLLTRLNRAGLIENSRAGHARGAPNAWILTGRGAEVERAVRGAAGE
jgi:AcrR family transcriptional regulator